MQDENKETSLTEKIVDRRQCPVCGHPTGDCRPQHDVELKDRGVFRETAALAEGKTIYVEEDIVEEREVAPHTRVNFVIARKGTYVTPSVAKELGII